MVDSMFAIQAMIAHSQYCSSGDHTLEAIDEAVSRYIHISCRVILRIYSDII